MTAPERFERQKDALAWLHERFGRPFPSAGKFSTDCRDGACVVQGDKSIRLKDLKAYAERIGFDRRAAALTVSKAEEREEWEIRKLKADVEAKEKANRKEEDRWLLKEDAHAQMAAIVGLLRDSLRHHAHRAAAALVYLAGGEAGRAPEVYEGIEEEILARAFNEVAGAGRVEVVFEGGEE